MVSTSQPKPIGGVKLSKPKANFWRPKVTTTSNQVDAKKDSDPKGLKQASTSNVKSGKDPQSSNSFGILESLVDEDVLGFVSNGKGSQDHSISKMQSQVPGEAFKSSTIPSSSTSATKKALEQSTIRVLKIAPKARLGAKSHEALALGIFLDRGSRHA